LGHDVDGARLGDPVAALGDHAGNDRAQLGDAAGGEGPTDEPPQPAVVGRIGEEHVVAGLLEELATTLGGCGHRPHGVTRLGARPASKQATTHARVAQHGEGVVVPGQDDRPESAAQDRRRGPQPGIERVRVGATFRREQDGGEELVGGGIGHNRQGRLSRPGRQNC
jgi:hypothetical protein